MTAKELHDERRTILDHFRADIYRQLAFCSEGQTEVLVISLQDDLGRKLYKRLYPDMKPPAEGAAICFEKLGFFQQVIKALSGRDFNPVPGHFGCGIYHEGGMSVFRLPSPEAKDGQNKVLRYAKRR